MGVCRITGLSSACSLVPPYLGAPPARPVYGAREVIQKMEWGTWAGVPAIPSLVLLEEGHGGLRMLLAGTSLAPIWDEPTTPAPGGPPSSQSGPLLPPPILLLPFASGEQALKGRVSLAASAPVTRFIFCLAWVLLGHLGTSPIMVWGLLALRQLWRCHLGRCY